MKWFPVSTCNTDVDTIRVRENPPLKKKAGHSGCVCRRHSERMTANHSERMTANHNAGCCQRKKTPISVEGSERKEAPLKLRPQQPHGDKRNKTSPAPPRWLRPQRLQSHAEKNTRQVHDHETKKKGRKKTKTKNPSEGPGFEPSTMETTTTADWTMRHQGGGDSN